MKKINFSLFVLILSVSAWGSDVFMPQENPETAVFGDITLTAKLKTENRLAPNKSERRLVSEVKVERINLNEQSSFTAQCFLSGKVLSNKDQHWLDCLLNPETVSNDDNDDDEALSFRIGETVLLEARDNPATYELSKVRCVGDGSLLEEKLFVLLLNGKESLSKVPKSCSLENISMKRETSDPRRDPLALASYVSESLRDLLGKKVYSQELNRKVSVDSVDYTLEDHATIRVTLNLAEEGRLSVVLPNEVNLFEDLAHWGGLVSQADLLKRVEAQLKKL